MRHPSPRMVLFRLIWLVLILLWSGSAAADQTVELPIRLDYNFLRAVFIRQAFTAPGRTARPVGGEDECLQVVLSEPEFTAGSGDQPTVKLTVAIAITGGPKLMGECLNILNWRGFLELTQRPVLHRSAWRLAFTTLDSRLLGSDRRPARLAGLVWDAVKDRIHAHLDQVTIDLAPPKGELEQLLPLLISPDRRAEVEAWLASLRPGQVSVDDQAVKIGLLMDVNVPPATEPLAPEPPATEADRAKLLEAWQTWDAFLVHQIMSLKGHPLTEADRTTILTTLLELRHGLAAALEPENLNRDLVREQFLAAWSSLAPILRRQLIEPDSPRLISYLAFFTASDALVALTELGPTLGLDISRQGLIRLARLIGRSDAPDLLRYDYRLEAGLRELLGLDQLPTGPAPPPDWDSAPPPADGGGSGGNTSRWRLWPLGVGRAWAADLTTADLLVWLPPRSGDARPYLDRVEGLLKQATEAGQAKAKLKSDRAELFSLLILATAWQESCWRQFTVVNDKISPLRSYNNTSVGLMQINERVWRGLYDRESLRWDIRYNVRAGIDILAIYLLRYALGKSADLTADLEPGDLASLVYAMYNGGPSQLKRFLKRREKGKLYLSDKLFIEKLNLVKAGRLDKVADCLLGTG